MIHTRIKRIKRRQRVSLDQPYVKSAQVVLQSTSWPGQADSPKDEGLCAANRPKHASTIKI